MEPVSVRPQMGTEIQVGPTGKTLLPLSVERPGVDLVAVAQSAGESAGASAMPIPPAGPAVPTGPAVPWQTTAGAQRERG